MRTIDITKLKQQTGVTGAEKIPVSSGEYITVDQILGELDDDFSQMGDAVEGCVKKSDKLILDCGSPADLIDTNN